MGFLDRLFGLGKATAPAAAAPQAAPKFTPPPVPPSLPRIPEPSAAGILRACRLDPAALGLHTAGQTARDFLAALQAGELAADMIRFLAHGLAEREAVAWAVQAARMASAKMPQQELAAIAAAEAWVRNPAPDRQDAAARAALASGHQAPGGWAAQAAAWSSFGKMEQTPAPSARQGGGELQPPAGLTAHAVQGAVLLAVQLALEGKPRAFSDEYPFIAPGLALAAGGA